MAQLFPPPLPPLLPPPPPDRARSLQREKIGCNSSRAKKVGVDTLKIGWGPACLDMLVYLPFWSKVECLGFGHFFLNFLQN